MPVLALSYFTPSDALLADSELIRTTLQITASADGCLGQVSKALYALILTDDPNLSKN